MRVVYLILVILLAQSCGPNTQQVKYLKQNYSAEAINYFYETGFLRDSDKKRPAVQKWKKDIYIYMTGDFYPDDIDHVKNTIVQLDSLQLPIDIQLTPDSLNANMFIYFGDYPYLEKMGIGDSLSTFYWYFQVDYNKSAIVGIANNAETYKNYSETDNIKIRQAIILKAMTHCLGIMGNSLHYPNSTFFKEEIWVSNFCDIDKSIIKLLYEPSIPNIYLEPLFETDFEDILYHINAPQKIADYVLSNNTPLHYLEYIRKNCFLLDSILVKWPSETNIRLNGDVSAEDSLFCKDIINQLNTISDQFNLTLAGNIQRTSTIDIHYGNNDTMKHDIQYNQSLNIGNSMFPRRTFYEIDIVCNGKEDIQKRKNRFIADILYGILAFKNDDITKDFTELDSLGNISFQTDYREILALIYEPVFYSGLTIKELDEAIEILKTKGLTN